MMIFVSEKVGSKPEVSEVVTSLPQPANRQIAHKNGVSLQLKLLMAGADFALEF